MRRASRADAFLLVVSTILMAGCSSAIPVSYPPPALEMGIEVDALQPLAQRGINMHYGVVWVGAWNLDGGWAGAETALRRVVEHNATPLVQFYYWGDDLSPECFAQGCQAGTMTKNQEGWHRLAAEFSDVARRTLGDRPFVVVVESEFNKHEMHASDEWDRALANMTFMLRAGLPNARLVLGFGNWGDGFWQGFDQAAAAADAIGLQAMRATTVDDPESYVAIAHRTVTSARILQDEFGKPILLHDVALSSYPEPDGLRLQEEAMRAWVEAAPELSDAGVEAFVYRSYWDTPGTMGYFQSAEQHWGLVWTTNQTEKPAFDEWAQLAAKSG